MSESPVAIVVAAGQGLGEACTRELAARGYALVLMTRSDAAEKLAGELGGTGIAGDLSKTADLARLVDVAMEKHGRIDALFNNTGHVTGGGIPARGSAYDPDAGGDLLEVADESWIGGLDMILLNVIRAARLVTPIMERQGGGAILNMSSFAQVEPSPAFPVGTCLRMALSGFTKLYADKYAAKGIRMNNILPGFIENYGMSDELRRQVPMGRQGTLEEVAKAAGFLLSADSGYITGQSILLDGGLNRGV
jgi:NAD(P)-dependent dehydrogenase (short-subunit alcohol dehydrogenase family)